MLFILVLLNRNQFFSDFTLSILHHSVLVIHYNKLNSVLKNAYTKQVLDTFIVIIILLLVDVDEFLSKKSELKHAHLKRQHEQYVSSGHLPVVQQVHSELVLFLSCFFMCSILIGTLLFTGIYSLWTSLKH